MEKYSDTGISTKHISSDDIQSFNGLQNETFISFDIAQGMNFPLRVSMCGITYPTKNYYIKRSPVRGFVLEYVISGQGYVIVDGKKHMVSAGNCYLLKMGEQCEYFADESNPYHKLWVNFYGSFAHDIVSKYQLIDTVYFCNLNGEFEKLFKLEEISTSLSVIHFKAAAIITDMLLKLAESCQQPKNASEIAKQVYRKIITSINLPFRLEDLSKELCISKSELIRHFKRAYGIPPYKYLINLRINHAKNMLTNEKLSVSEIAEFLCFSDQFYFANIFKQHVGISPLQYRKKMKNTNEY